MPIKFNSLKLALDFLDSALPSDAKQSFENRLSNVNTTLAKLEQDARRKAIESEAEYLTVETEIQQLKVAIFNSPRAGYFLIEDVIQQLEKEICKAIDDGDNDKTRRLLDIGHTLFQTSDVQHHAFQQTRVEAAYNRCLCHAVTNLQLDAATLLLKNGTNPNGNESNFRASNGYVSPIDIASYIRDDSGEFIKLLLAYGAEIDFSQTGAQSVFYCPIERGNKAIIRMLVAEAIKKSNGNFEELSIYLDDPVRRTLENQSSETIDFLFGEIKAVPGLYEKFLSLFLSQAPLTLLHHFVEDDDNIVENILALPLADLDEPTTTEMSGIILLKTLLKNKENSQQRLEVLKAVTRLWMKLDYLEPALITEPCYAEKARLEDLAVNSADGPIKELAQQLLDSMEEDSQQGRIAVGYRVIYNLMLENQDAAQPFEFSAGVTFLITALGKINEVCNSNNSAPPEDIVDAIIDATAIDITSMLGTAKQPVFKTTVEASRFRAMVGSSIFTRLNPGLEPGGYSVDAALWYGNFLLIIIQSMRKIGMLGDEWDEETVMRLLQEISTPGSERAQDKNKPIGFDLDLPGHYVPSCIYKYQGEWRYTVMCRAFLPNGAVDFTIPDDSNVASLKKAILERRKTSEKLYASPNRQILFDLLNHLLDVEKLTGTPCRYSARPTQKQFKESICFAANYKPFLSLLLTIMTKPSTTARQWEDFNRTLKASIFAEVIKAGISLTEFQSDDKVTEDEYTSPATIAYKLSTSLMRWIEINHFNPSNENEALGKTETVKHVVVQTKKRISSAFFKEDQLTVKPLYSPPKPISRPMN